MVKYSTNSSKDFNSKDWSEKLIKAGFDMSDANYFIGSLHNELYVVHQDDPEYLTLWDKVPVYTVYDILCKLRHASPLRDNVLKASTSICRGKTIEEFIFYSVDPANAGMELLLAGYKLMTNGQ